MNAPVPPVPPHPFADVDTPAVLADLDIVERNIRAAAAFCARAGMRFRPHVKTHKIPEFARMQTDAGAVGICCQKIGEAEVFADAGIRDIFIPYNIVGADKLRRLKTLAGRVRLSVAADSEFVLRGLSAAFADAPSPLPTLIECETGLNRCGAASPEDAAALAGTAKALPGIQFAGLMTYPPVGGAARADRLLAETKALCERAGLACEIVSSGGTPEFRAAEKSAAANEWRAGTYIYNDRSLVARGACGRGDCALTVLATVVSVPAAGRAVVDAGSKSLSSDLLNLSDHGELLDAPEIRVAALSEEHGMLDASAAPGFLAPGDRVRILPNHACVVSNLADEIIAVRGSKFERRIPVAARGKTR